jgi:heme oxygenase
MLRGRASRAGYALFLRNLHPAYLALERGLERNGRDPRLAPLALPELYRALAIERDLAALCGARAAWPEVLGSAADYADRIGAADGPRLLAHAYVRYLGDLSGGRILGRLLARSPGLPFETLGFYEFPAIDDMETFRARYRRAIDHAPLTPDEARIALSEACAGFEHNIRLSTEVAAKLSG